MAHPKKLAGSDDLHSQLQCNRLNSTQGLIQDYLSNVLVPSS